MATKLPPMLRGVRKGSEVRFAYTFADGEQGRITGYCVSATTKDGEITGLRVQIGSVPAALHRHQPAVAKAIAKDSRQPVVSFALARISPAAEPGLIIPVSVRERRPGTGAARYLAPPDAQVRRALALSARTCPGGGNYPSCTEAEFRAMSPAAIAEWISMAEEELGAWL